jgi:hypothetical protein
VIILKLCRSSRGLLLALGILTLSVGAARSQYVPPYGPNPYGPYGANNYIESPIGGFMNGTANVINAQGQWYNQVQSASIENEKFKQAKIQTQRQKFDESNYERFNMVNQVQDRQRQVDMINWRLQHSPSQGDILGGQALNSVLTAIQGAGGGYSAPRSVTMSPTVLRMVGVTDGSSQGGIVMLTDGSPLHWPRALGTSTFDADRQKVNQLLATAIQQGKVGAVNPDLLNDVTNTVNNMQNTLKAQIDNVPVNDFMTAKRYLNQLLDAINTLSGPNVTKYLTGEWSARGETIADVIENMTNQGLTFAPAIMGAEGAYNSTYRAMETMMPQQVAFQANPGQRNQPPPPR